MARSPPGAAPIILPWCKILDSDEYSTRVNGDGGWRKDGHGGCVVEDVAKVAEDGEEVVEGKGDHCRENTKGRELAEERREWENAGENAEGWRSLSSRNSLERGGGDDRRRPRRGSDQETDLPVSDTKLM